MDTSFAFVTDRYILIMCKFNDIHSVTKDAETERTGCGRNEEQVTTDLKTKICAEPTR